MYRARSASGIFSPTLAAQEDLEGEQRPEGLTVICAPCVVLGQEAVQRFRHEVSPDTCVRGAERRAEIGPELRAEPEVQRDTEAPLAARHDLGRKQVGHRRLE